MLRWGILGVNTTAEESVGPAMRSVGHDLAVVSAETLTAAQQFAATQGVRRARRDHTEVLVSSDVDAVFVALPTSEAWRVHRRASLPIPLGAQISARSDSRGSAGPPASGSDSGVAASGTCSICRASRGEGS